ncbi:MAG: ABC transporter ATP-binding protein [Firmicutes bacterium]|nr:ABC transporter ATP-binding protein [Bacillota bacterium]
MSNAIQMTGVSFSYGNTPTLDAVDLRVETGEFLGLVGPNGGGKTTLLKLMLGLLVPGQGKIKVYGQPPERARKVIGYVPQFADVDRSFPISVMDVVLMGRLGLTGFLGMYTEGDRRIARLAMQRVGVWGLRHRRLGSLSEGQRQRVLIARALAVEPRLMVLDEPTASIDPTAEQAISQLLRELYRSTTIVMVSHDLELLNSHADRLLYVNRQLLPFEDGQMLFTGKLRPPRD